MIEDSGPAQLVGVVPDYANRLTRNHNANYTADQDGWIYIYSRGGDTGAGLNVSVVLNGISYPLAYRINDFGPQVTVNM